MKQGKDKGMHLEKSEKMCDFNMSLIPLNFSLSSVIFGISLYASKWLQSWFTACKTRLPLLNSSSFVVSFSPFMDMTNNFSVNNPMTQQQYKTSEG